MERKKSSRGKRSGVPSHGKNKVRRGGKTEKSRYEKKSKSLYQPKEGSFQKNQKESPFREKKPGEYAPKSEWKSRREDSDKTGFERKKGKPFREKKPGEYAPHPDWKNRSTEKRSSRFASRNKKRSSFSSDQAGEGLIRLNKFISTSGICSRREADDLITAGLVSVNGIIVTKLGHKIAPNDEIRYNGALMRRERMVYVLLNKPKDFITTTDDPQDRKTVMYLVEKACRERIYPVGRLDRATTGVLVLTNDGELTKKLTHPASKVKKLYHVTLDQNLKSADLKKIAEGIELEDGMAYVDGISYVGEAHAKNEVGMELHSGRNRIVRRIFEALGYKVTKLDRTVFAGLTKKDLPRGKWRFLSEAEVRMLKKL